MPPDDISIPLCGRRVLTVREVREMMCRLGVSTRGDATVLIRPARDER